ncbi:hypothetical protein FRACYDRAFT_239604 [Fragilariopsis cylindrus CCMP1102]|uniref:Uncharacterized protein n=1 Tax=Fragilariopsis cylindrus CCMP1102 TaxID=635003 RepID=A0A1E7FG40_9STRA|nr:hypothetical protein FRACYDRAFT_239604 [Fragilariopsis cylindrus CCMP1102]|eukprot:OEU17005.1 hypothetical protein FRACYDRAFT_239604 [Fragilariopsis cylindrus CCMP1102]
MISPPPPPPQDQQQEHARVRRSRVSDAVVGSRTTTTGTGTGTRPPRKSKSVQFCSIEIREHERLLGDHPCTLNGPPLGLDWSYTDYGSPIMGGIPILLDEYEKEKKQNQIQEFQNQFKLSLQQQRLQQQQQQRLKRRASAPGSSTNNNSTSTSTTIINNTMNSNNSNDIITSNENGICVSVITNKEDNDININNDDTIISNDNDNNNQNDDEEEDNIISNKIAKHLQSQYRMQPIPGSIRKQIILNETRTTPQAISNAMKQIKKIQNQRRSTLSMIEIGLDDTLGCMYENITRKFRRYKSGISKQREQELLWEKAAEEKTTTSSSSSSTSTCSNNNESRSANNDNANATNVGKRRSSILMTTSRISNYINNSDSSCSRATGTPSRTNNIRPVMTTTTEVDALPSIYDINNSSSLESTTLFVATAAEQEDQQGSLYQFR